MTNDFSPYGRARDPAVVEALPDSVEGVATGTPYAVATGTVVNGSGNPYKVFTPFSKAWRATDGTTRCRAPRNVEWVEADDDQRVSAMLDKALREAPEGMPTPGEDAALRRLRSFLDRDVDDYDEPATTPAPTGRRGSRPT